MTTSIVRNYGMRVSWLSMTRVAAFPPARMLPHVARSVGPRFACARGLGLQGAHVPMARTFADGPRKPSYDHPPPPVHSSKPPEANTLASEPVHDHDAPVTGGLRERLRVIMRRYGWWALGIYLGLSLLDFSLTFAAIHFYGGDNIRELDRVVRGWLGLAKPEVKPPKPVTPSPDAAASGTAQAAAVEEPSDWDELASRLSTEAVLAYGIHKTVFLPVRAGITAAFTPAIVRWMVRRGWARPIKVAAKATAASAMERAHIRPRR